MKKKKILFVSILLRYELFCLLSRSHSQSLYLVNFSQFPLFSFRIYFIPEISIHSIKSLKSNSIILMKDCLLRLCSKNVIRKIKENLIEKNIHCERTEKKKGNVIFTIIINKFIFFHANKED